VLKAIFVPSGDQVGFHPARRNLSVEPFASMT
jgi:hypothetical protein